MIFVPIFLVVAASLTVILWLRSRAPARRGGAGSPYGPIEPLTFMAGKVRRVAYLLRGPIELRARLMQPRPVVLGFHGGNGQPMRFAETSSLPRPVLAAGMALALPEASPRWADGRDTTEAAWANDLLFLDALTKRLTSEPDLDTNNLFAVGVSNGAMLTLRLGCEFGDRFRGLASVLGNMPEDYITRVPPGPPVPLMLVHADQDMLMPPQGGEIPSVMGIAAGGRVISADATVQFWRARNRCAGAAQATVTRIGSHQARVVTYPAGPNGAELCVITL
uniref:alpha/beta hydrolase family esterase n=1 Tax=Actibacterium sp. TaxID=1872125 RepID=UPI0035669216